MAPPWGLSMLGAPSPAVKSTIGGEYAAGSDATCSCNLVDARFNSEIDASSEVLAELLDQHLTLVLVWKVA